MKSGERNSQTDIRPLTKEEGNIVTSRLEKIVIGLQTFGNALQRQTLTNLGTMRFNETSSHKLKVDSSTLTDGLGSRLAYQAIATYPALVLRNKLIHETNTSQFMINLATCGTETMLGVIPEVNSSLKTFKKMGIDIPRKELLSVSTRAFLPYLCRNGLAWMAINSNTDDSVKSNIMYGAAAGAASTYFHNMGDMAIKNTIGKTWPETAEIVKQEIMKKPMGFFKGAPFRSASIAATSLFLAPQTTKYLEKQCQELCELLFSHEKPSDSPQNANAYQSQNVRGKS